MTGNRGILHDDHRNIVRNHLSRAWITCVLSWKGRTRAVMTGRKWTELFFLDEATALAAGHRPCAYCRRGDYNDFVTAWSTANPAIAPTTGRRAPVVDAALHSERRTTTGAKATSRQQASSLPRGTMVLVGEKAHLVTGQLRVVEWSFAGYGSEFAIADQPIDVLTPASTVGALRHGFEPVLHPTAP